MNQAAGPVAQVFTTGFETCLIRPNGVAQCYGDLSMSQPNVTKVAIVSNLAYTTGSDGVCFLLATGNITCSAVPVTIPPVKYLDLCALTGDAGLCALAADGSVTCYPIPSEVVWPASRPGPYTAIVCGYGNVCAFRPDSTAECWDYCSSFYVSS